MPGRVGWMLALLALLALAAQTGWPLKTELAMIRLYQRFGSPVAARVVHCRFEPTCSHYAIQALETEEFLKGNWLIIQRLAFCSPLGFFYDWITR